MDTTHTQILQELFKKYSGKSPDQIDPLVGAGSNRRYYRLVSGTESYIGVVGEDQEENMAFLYLSDQFRKHGFNVPEVFVQSDIDRAYLQEDLGDVTLFDLLLKEQDRDRMAEATASLYRQSLLALIEFQVEASKSLDYSRCYPRREFDRQSMQWDLNYFKYYHLKPAGVVFNEQRLETDFGVLMDFLLEAPSNYFMYRDFQARNIMIRSNEPWFIDFQGGRKGPLQYDVASLLFQARADLPPAFREKMLQFYMEELGKRVEFDREEFVKYYYGFVLLRTMQVLGAYGFRGYFEQKPHFIESTRFALKNLAWLMEHVTLPVNLPELSGCFRQLLVEKTIEKSEGLVVEINSFSYKKSGIPRDNSGHGGGFVFDCRALPNPGRFEEYRHVTGKDEAVINFLQKEKPVGEFLSNVYRIVDQAMENYMERGFDHLSVNFGCTGGQHRSVYCAENLHRHLQEKFKADIRINHRMLNRSAS